MKYKVNDRVRIKSLDWYNRSKDNYGSIYAGNGFCFWKNMARHCGEIMKITIVKIDPEDSNKGYYFMENSEERWTDEIIEGLVEEETYDFLKTDKPNRPSLNDFMDMLDNEIKLPEGYQFKDENGNVVNATKIVLEKLVVPKFKKGDKIKDKNNRVWYVEQVGNKHFDISRIPNGGSGYFVPIEDQDYYELVPDIELPKTFEECVSVLEGKNRMSLELMNTFRKLIDARNAYWKIYGEDNGLGKPWEPDYKNECQKKYCIYNNKGDITKSVLYSANAILSFPTKEMRDAFYENFKDEIESCKEFL